MKSDCSNKPGGARQQEVPWDWMPPPVYGEMDVYSKTSGGGDQVPLGPIAALSAGVTQRSGTDEDPAPSVIGGASGLPEMFSIRGK